VPRDPPTVRYTREHVTLLRDDNDDDEDDEDDDEDDDDDDDDNDDDGADEKDDCDVRNQAAQ
jgi:hypothetical protein